MKTHVRRAWAGDASSIFRLLIEMHADCDLDYPPMNYDKVMATVVHHIANHIVLLAIEDDTGHVVGSVGGSLGSHWFSDDRFIGDLWFYVARAGRKSRAAFQLRDAFLDLGQQLGVPVKMGDAHGGDLERKEAFFTRGGLKKSGSFYTRGF